MLSKVINIVGFFNAIKNFFIEHFGKVTADTLGWLAVIVLHASTIPSLLTVMAGISDRTPSLDLILFVWASLVLLFARSIILKDQLNIITIGIGFIAQSVMMALILFK